jgi:Family of unknown function (DUF5302)
MTETAKQDPKKAPAEPTATGAFETRAAATQDDSQPETIAEPEEAASTEEPAKADLDETKRKFREALERKHQAHNDGQGKGSRDGSKINGAHGPAASRRNFRRKSG